MNRELSLTDAVMDYKECGEDWHVLYDRIRIFVYAFPYRCTDWDEDKCSEFFLAFHSRIPGLVERFQPDHPFETYLMASLKWFMKTFTEKLAARECYEEWAVEISRPGSSPEEAISDSKDESYQSSEMQISDDCPFSVDGEGHLKNTALRRRILFITLMKAADLEDVETEAIARLTDVDPTWLFERAECIRSCIKDKIERREHLRQRRNECWYRQGRAARRLQAEEVREGRRREEWKYRTKVWKSRHQSSCERLRKLKVAPSHEEIGRILGVPEGTVSSGIHLLRKTWNSLEGRDTANPGRPGIGIPLNAKSSLLAGGRVSPTAPFRDSPALPHSVHELKSSHGNPPRNG